MTEFVMPYHPAVNAARSVACVMPVGTYDENARVEDAPARFSATSLVVWSYATLGIELEDDILALYVAGERIIGSDLWSGDLLFRTGRRDRFPDGRSRYGIGHVGLYTGEGTVVHASPFIGCVHEDLIGDFYDMGNGHYRGTVRLHAR